VALRLGDELQARADAEAKRRGISLSALVRVALERELTEAQEERDRGAVESAGRAAVDALRAGGWLVGIPILTPHSAPTAATECAPVALGGAVS